MAIIKKFRIKSFKETKPIIKLENISLSFKNRNILDNISFSLNQGQILGLLGPNGVGKSTIFNLITGLISPKSGKIKINGELVEIFYYSFGNDNNWTKENKNFEPLITNIKLTHEWDGKNDIDFQEFYWNNNFLNQT